MLIDPATFGFERKAPFVVLEGVNGAGKSSLLESLSGLLKQKNIDFVLTREPGATEFGKHIRRLVLESKDLKFSALAELFLFCADRAEHIRQVIEPSLKQCQVVLSDRYFYSSLAFQSFGRGLDFEMAEQICAFAVNDNLPDLVILLDLDPQIGLKRNRAQFGREPDNLENEKSEFHRKIRAGFLEMAKSRSEPFWVLDAAQARNALHGQVLEFFREKL